MPPFSTPVDAPLARVARSLALSLLLALPIACADSPRDGRTSAAGRDVELPLGSSALPASAGLEGLEAAGAQAEDDSVALPNGGLAAGDSEAARRLLREYYDAISAGDYERAYGLWGDGGKASGQTFLEFAAGYGATERVRAEVGAPGRIEGAAGSRYIRIPVVVQATTREGRAQRFEGTYTLRRSVVDGATEAQRHWHLYDAEIRQVR